jgi:RNA polymerase sigma-70 factor (ECF subfamily)
MPETPQNYTLLSVEELVRTCGRSRDIKAWEEFIRRFHRLIAVVVLRAVRRWGECSSQTVDDLIQETYLKLCEQDFRLLRDFVPRGPDSFFGFLKVVAANVAHDHFRLTSAAKRRGDQVTDCFESVTETMVKNPVGSVHALEGSVLLNQVAQYLNHVVSGPDEGRNRTIFWLYYRYGLSASAIAALPSIRMTTKAVESAIHRMTRSIKCEMARAREDHSHVESSGEGIRPPDAF